MCNLLAGGDIPVLYGHRGTHVAPSEHPETNSIGKRWPRRRVWQGFRDGESRIQRNLAFGILPRLLPRVVPCILG